MLLLVLDGGRDGGRSSWQGGGSFLGAGLLPLTPLLPSFRKLLRGGGSFSFGDGAGVGGFRPASAPPRTRPTLHLLGLLLARAPPGRGQLRVGGGFRLGALALGSLLAGPGLGLLAGGAEQRSVLGVGLRERHAGLALARSLGLRGGGRPRAGRCRAHGSPAGC